MGSEKGELTNAQLKDLHRKTGIDKDEIQRLHKNFARNIPNGRLRKKDLVKLFKKSYKKGDASSFVEHLVRTQDLDDTGDIDFIEFMNGFCVFLNASCSDQVEFVFRMCDMDGNQAITEEEFRQVFRAMHETKFGSHYDVKAADTECHHLFCKLDVDHDHKVTAKEFVKCAERDETVLLTFRMIMLSVVNDCFK